MKWNVLAASAAFALATLEAAAAPPRPAIERSPDMLPARKANASAARAALSQAQAPLGAAAAAPTPEDVGDADSFGRAVINLGYAQTLAVTLLDDCTGSDPTVERCIVQQPAPLPTFFNEADLAMMKLPARATKSHLCFTLTPAIDVSFVNATTAPQTARFSAFATVIIDNEVLADPTLVNPITGLPFNGSLPLALRTWRTARSLQPGEFEETGSTQSRACIGGFVSKRVLVETYGLTESQANQFFRKPMTLHFGVQGTVSMSEFASYLFGLRLFGD